MMLLTQLLPQATKELSIRGLKLDSRLVQQGDLFFAVKGAQQDGRAYIEQALQGGAVAIVYDPENYQLACTLVNQYPQAEFIAMDNLQQNISAIAERFYGEPAKLLRLIGVTGTNGKTSVTQLIAQALDLLGEKCGIMGTLGAGFWHNLQAGKQTTPDAITIQANLAMLLGQGAKAVALEVSSHGLDQGRVAALPFQVATFTNLTRDHLDYHKTLENYGEAKAKLFTCSTLTSKVINKDDKFGRQLVLNNDANNLLSYSIEDQTADLYCQDILFSDKGVQAKLNTPCGMGYLQSSLIGRFNLSNLLAVIGSLIGLGYAVADILSVIPKLEGPAGRMQRIGGQQKPLVVIDYAHTPDALEKVLMALRPHVLGKLVCVFGCGGDRDTGKRPLMATIAERLADKVVVTDDNPRTERSDLIISDILQGFTNKQKVQVLADRREAIKQTIGQSKVEDIILLAGKGHENYQEIAGIRHHFSDVEEASQALLGWGK